MFIDKLITLFSQAALRLERMPGYTLLSMLGLVLSLSGTVIIARYLHQEWTIDSWMPQAGRTYILCRQFMEGNYSGHYSPTNDSQMNNVEGFVSPTEGQSDVEAFTEIRIQPSNFSITLESGDKICVPTISADSCFADVFPLKAAEGTLVPKVKGQIIVSDDFARRFFPGESAVGRTLKLGNKEELHTIIGVFRTPQSKSTIRFDVLYFEPKAGTKNNCLIFTVLRLTEGADAEAYNARQPELKDMVNPKYRYQIVPYKGNLARQYGQVMPHRQYGQAMPHEYRSVLSKVSSPEYLWMLFGVGVLLFFVGLFNFLNLYAVMRHTREHEMRVRRIFGASKWNIFSMLYMENLLISAPAMLGVWMVIEITTPHMKDWFDIEQLTMPLFDTILSLSIMFILPLVATAGIIKRSRRGSASFLFLQYFISLTLITVSLYLMRQLHMMMNSDPGYTTEHLMKYKPRQERNWIMIEDDLGKASSYIDNRAGGIPILHKLRECPYIEKAVDMEHNIIGASNPVEVEGQKMLYCPINASIAEMMGLELLEGRMLCDSLDFLTYHCLLNETAVRQLGLKDWHTDSLQLGSRLFFARPTDRMSNPPYQVVGVMRDFHPGRLSEPQPAIIFTYHSEWEMDRVEMLPNELLMSIKPGSEQATIKYLRRMSKEILGTEELEYQWLSDQKADLYSEDRRAARIFFTFALLAIGVTCLGVLGLMMFDVRRRYREIALRKVHGALFRDIALLLSRRYLIILGLAAAVSIPVSLIGLHKLITRYYSIHASVAWWIPLVSLALVFLLSALTLWHQIWRATRIAPSEVMKVE